MDEEHIPREQMRRVVAAADLAYDAARWAVGRPRSAEQGPPLGDATAERDAAPRAVAGIPCAGRSRYAGPSSDAPGRDSSDLTHILHQLAVDSFVAGMEYGRGEAGQ